MRLLILIATASAIGCKAPADAPEELNELTAFIFEHAQDTDPAQVEQGVANLETWMSKRLEETQDGYVVNNLTPESVGSLDQCTRDITGLVGAAVGTTSKYQVDELTTAWLTTDPLRVSDAFVSYHRDILVNDIDCFLEQDCDTLHYDSYSTKKLALGIEAESVNRVQWRWVEMCGYEIHW